MALTCMELPGVGGSDKEEREGSMQCSIGCNGTYIAAQQTQLAVALPRGSLSAVLC